MSRLFTPTRLFVAVVAATLSTQAMSAGLDRSGQDMSAFLQDGTYAEAVYTYIDADVTGHDNADFGSQTNFEKGNEFDDIAPDYDFFRYGVKTDVNDTLSVGVLYDEPFGAQAAYTGDNDFTGTSAKVAAGVLDNTRLTGLANTGDKIEQLQAAQQNDSNPINQIIYSSALAGLQNSQANFASLPEYPTIEQINEVIAASEQSIAQSEATLNNPPIPLPPETEALGRQLVEQNKADLDRIRAARDTALSLATNDAGNTEVEVRTYNLSLIGGVKLGEDKRFQVYGGPVLQRAEADVKLRGNAYGAATGYNATVAPDLATGWLAGISYSIPEIALKAALTYRSEIEHETDVAEEYPVLAAQGLPTTATMENTVTTPESVNLNFQTGLSQEHQLLGTLNVRWVPWSDFAITPPLYNAASKLRYPQGLDLINYSEDQWQVDVGLGKRLTPKLAVSGVVGWDSGAGNPVTSLGPVEGYWSVGGGAKYNVTDEWAVSLGGKYLMFGDATGSLPDDTIVSRAEDNDGYAMGVKLSYQSQ